MFRVNDKSFGDGSTDKQGITQHMQHKMRLLVCHMSYVICLCGLYGKKVRLSGKVYQSSWRTEESPKLYQVGMRGQVSRFVLASVGGGGSP